MTERTKIERVGGHLLIGESAIPIERMRAFSFSKADFVQCNIWIAEEADCDPIPARGWTAREILEVAYGGGEWLYHPKPTDETRALVDEINALVEAGTEEIERLRARVAELERARDACRVELDAARAAVGEAWFAGGATLAEAIERKCRALEGLVKDEAEPKSAEGVAS